MICILASIYLANKVCIKNKNEKVIEGFLKKPNWKRIIKNMKKRKNNKSVTILPRATRRAISPRATRRAKSTTPMAKSTTPVAKSTTPMAKSTTPMVTDTLAFETPTALMLTDDQINSLRTTLFNLKKIHTNIQKKVGDNKNIDILGYEESKELRKMYEEFDNDIQLLYSEFDNDVLGETISKYFPIYIHMLDYHETLIDLKQQIEDHIANLDDTNTQINKYSINSIFSENDDAKKALKIQNGVTQSASYRMGSVTSSATSSAISSDNANETPVRDTEQFLDLLKTDMKQTLENGEGITDDPSSIHDIPYSKLQTILGDIYKVYEQTIKQEEQENLDAAYNIVDNNIRYFLLNDGNYSLNQYNLDALKKIHDKLYNEDDEYNIEDKYNIDLTSFNEDDINKYRATLYLENLMRKSEILHNEIDIIQHID